MHQKKPYKITSNNSLDSDNPKGIIIEFPLIDNKIHR